MIKELYKKVYKKDSDKIFRYISRPIAFIFLKPLTYLPITANQISLLSIALALISAVIISFSGYRYNILACLILQIVLILDCTDGMLARYRNCLTKYGLYMEFLFHEIVPASLFFALGINAYKQIDNIIPVYLGGIIVLLIFFINISKGSKERIVLYNIQETGKIIGYAPYRLSDIRNKSYINKFIATMTKALNSPGHFFTILLILAIFDRLYYVIFFYSIFYFVIAVCEGYLELSQGFKPYGLK